METVALKNSSFPSALRITVRFYRIISKQRTTRKYVVYWDFGYERKTMVLLLNVNGEGRNGFLIEFSLCAIWRWYGTCGDLFVLALIVYCLAPVHNIYLVLFYTEIHKNIHRASGSDPNPAFPQSFCSNYHVKQTSHSGQGQNGENQVMVTNGKFVPRC